MPSLKIADLPVQIERPHAVGGEREERNLRGPQKRMPGESCKLYCVDPRATESLPRHALQKPSAIRADFCPGRLDHALHFAAGGKFIEINVHRNVCICKSSHVK